jgi:hypothetical protein
MSEFTKEPFVISLAPGFQWGSCFSFFSFLCIVLYIVALEEEKYRFWIFTSCEKHFLAQGKNITHSKSQMVGPWQWSNLISIEVCGFLPFWSQLS